ncbi:MAG: U32 family peptidase [Oscillospiraceae bacterium]|jgi:putative protease|nr:U32 family peptidase [Oscillospiraceae bacterium]
MLEILSPAGSPEGVVAAVQNGADAVYLGMGDFNARRNAKNFSESDFATAAEYCRVRGVKVYLTLNTLVSDREIHGALAVAKTAAKLGADAFIVQDLGLMRALRQVLPDVPLHASTQMGVHNLEGAKLAAAMGLSRVILARELPRDEIRHITKNAPIETEIFVHGALCMSYSGQCYFSSVIGRRSGNRGLCAQPCRLPYSAGNRAVEYPLSLKDNCLVGHLEELEKLGVTCVKIEGRMKRPEYAAIVTGIYSRAARENKEPSEDDLKALESAFSRSGFTDGYYTGKRDGGMFGVRDEDAKPENVMFSTARRNYLSGEFRRVPVRFVASVLAGEPMKLAAIDDRGNTAVATGALPELAFHRELTAATLKTQLHKTGGTPFLCVGTKINVDSGLSLPVSAVNELRRDILAELMEKRRPFTPPQEHAYIADEPSQVRKENETRETQPVLNISVLKAAQLSPELAALKPNLVYIPLEELRHKKQLEPLLEAGIPIAASLPRVIFDEEYERVRALLDAAKKLGIQDALVHNLGQVLTVRELGLNARGDFGLNVFNAQTLKTVRDLGLVSTTLSFELMLAQIRDIAKPIDTELIVYGRLPLMLTENCVIRNATGVCSCDNFAGLSDRRGVVFPVVREGAQRADYKCRTVVLNSRKLFMADRLEDWAKIGLWAGRLSFTTENAVECVSVFRRYLGLSGYEPGGITRGLYYKGVE